MLVVMVVISILVGLLIPAVGKARERGRRTACSANLRQIIAATQRQFDVLYYDPGRTNRTDALPDRGDCDDSGAAAEMLLPYVGNQPDIFNCPSNPGGGILAGAKMRIPSFPDASTEYEFNPYLANCGSNIRRLSALTNSSGIAYAYDYPWDPNGTAPRAHGDGINVGYFDGHVKWLSPSDGTFRDIGHPYAP
jgi:prepilin-type processing-associated H-X9-DG protein